MTYIKESIITKLQGLYRPPKNLRMGTSAFHNGCVLFISVLTPEDGQIMTKKHTALDDNSFETLMHISYHKQFLTLMM